MNAVAASQYRPLGRFGQGLSGFLLAVIVHEITWGLSTVALWFVSPSIGIIGGFAIAAGACAVAYDAVEMPAVRAGMRTYFWLLAMIMAVGVLAAMQLL